MLLPTQHQHASPKDQTALSIIGTLALVDSIVFGPSAKVFRVDPSQTDRSNLNTVLSVATEWATGLWPINGCAFGPDGSFYVSELINSSDFSGGDVVKIPFATPNVHTSLTNNTLLFPAGVAVGPDGNVYVSNDTAFVPQGQVDARLSTRRVLGSGARDEIVDATWSR
jgi:hypothetical protein